ncbi:hypothetical protein RU262_000358 [Salmonella enterica]|nr:hypothetical protein [Salmonella enterica subsp. enterica serovar Carno]EIM7944149.1 hypothetical protein [Salmonella enterica subsp. enterica serovar Carno]EIN7486680.1 hypothetical protein [Salmonella enterica subsp. enterica serovar Carno]ELK3069277.1 hypothetical protein [Salmonella enterica]HAK8989201.1 hypothetical protein [Salmonella enterica]
MKIGLSIKQKNILDSEIASFLASSSPEGFDLVDDKNSYLFDRAVKKIRRIS